MNNQYSDLEPAHLHFLAQKEFAGSNAPQPQPHPATFSDSAHSGLEPSHLHFPDGPEVPLSDQKELKVPPERGPAHEIGDADRGETTPAPKWKRFLWVWVLIGVLICAAIGGAVGGVLGKRSSDKSTSDANVPNSQQPGSTPGSNNTSPGAILGVSKLAAINVTYNTLPDIRYRYVFFQDPSNRLMVSVWSERSQNWTLADIKATAESRGAAWVEPKSGTTLAAMYSSELHLYYLSQTNVIVELSAVIGGDGVPTVWSLGNFTTLGKVADPDAQLACATYRKYGSRHRILAYLDSDQRIVVGNGTASGWNMSTISYTFSAVRGAGLSLFVEGSGENEGLSLYTDSSSRLQLFVFVGDAAEDQSERWRLCLLTQSSSESLAMFRIS